MDYADARTVKYSPAQVVDNVYQLLFATGMFTDGCRRWNSKTVADKTWANFKNHFAQKHREWKETQPTPAGATYQSANSLLPQPTRLPLNETAKSLALLAAATASDRETYSNLAATVTALTMQLVDENQKLVISLKKNTRLKRLLGEMQLKAATGDTTLRGHGQGGGGRGGGQGSHEGKHYCWTRGYDAGHASFRCSNPGKGHVRNCSAANNRGGSQNKKTPMRQLGVAWSIKYSGR